MRLKYLVYGLLPVLASCSWLRHPDPYLTAKNAPDLVMPPGVQERSPQPLFPVPPTRPVPNAWVSSDRQPIPEPVDLLHAKVAHAQTLGGLHWVVGLAQDGNGFPLLSIAGAGFDQTWDQLVSALQMAHIHYNDISRQLALVYLADKAPDAASHAAKSVKDSSGVQLKLVRGASAWQLSVEENADTMAPAEFSRSILQRIQAVWPKSPDH